MGRWVSDNARVFGNHVALDDSGLEVTYTELESRIAALAGALTDAGYGPGDRIATVTSNCATHVVLLFACARTGIALAPLSWRLSATELTAQLEIVDAVLVVHQSELASLTRSALDRLPEPPPSVLTTEVEARVPPREHRTPVTLPRPAQDDDPLLVLFTSGSSGAPKAAVLTHSNCFWTNLSFSRTVPLTHDDVVLSVMPQFHSGGWNVQTLLALWVGATVVLERHFDARRTLRLLTERRVTALMAVPMQYHMVATSPGFETSDLSALRTAVVGGAPMPAPLLRTWHARGVALIQGYGLTEASPNVLCLPAADAYSHAGSAGKPYPHLDVAVADLATGEHLDGEAEGELLVRGPGVFAGYLGDPEATAARMAGEWLRTGDLVNRDADGYYTILERLDDVMVVGGENVHPSEVEQVLLQHPAVANCGVVGAPDDARGQVPWAWVVRKPEVPVDEHELAAHCRGLLAAHKVPRRFIWADELPTAGLSKVQRSALRKEAQAWSHSVPTT
nr:AMP-binding protein [Tessaracoccus sp. OS52]